MRKCAALALLLAVTVGAQQTIVTVHKTPFEAFNLSMQFVLPAADSSDAIALDSVTSSNRGVDTTTAVIAASPVPGIVPATTTVAFRVQGGTVGDTQKISIRVHDTTTGEKFEGAMILQICDPCTQ